jgi:hypothetical protein
LHPEGLSAGDRPAADPLATDFTAHLLRPCKDQYPVMPGGRNKAAYRRPARRKITAGRGGVDPTLPKRENEQTEKDKG